jgi:positive regulator of sigma E activity
MTSEKYLKFLAVINILTYGIFSLLCYAMINKTQFLSTSGAIAFLVLFLFVLFFVQVRYPRKKGINPYQSKNANMMKQSILYWLKDERELMAALKTYAQGYFYSANMLYIIPCIILFLGVIGLNPKTVLNIIILIMFLENSYLNIMFVVDWKKYSK